MQGLLNLFAGAVARLVNYALPSRATTTRSENPTPVDRDGASTAGCQLTRSSTSPNIATLIR